MDIPEALLEELSRNPAVALPLHQLARRIPGSHTSSDDILRSLGRRPDLVRVLHVWRVAMAPLGSHPSELAPEVRDALARQGLDETTWIVPLGPAECPGGRWVHRRLRETVRYLGRIVDEDSPRAVTRWMRIVMEGRLVGELSP